MHFCAIHELAKVKPADAALVSCGALMLASTRPLSLENLQPFRHQRR
jgi:hypothetical protein